MEKTYRFRYSVSLDRVTGLKKDGGYFFGGSFLMGNRNDLTSAKLYAREEMKRGYYNHAEIYDRETGENIECFTGTEWRVAA